MWWFGGTSLTNDLASEMIYPLLPAFVTRTLGGGALALGVLDGVAEAVSAAFKLASGYLAERPRLRGPLVVAGYGVAALVRPLIAAAGAAWHVVTLRALDRIGKGVRSAPRDVMIADVVDEANRGRAFGVHRSADHAGAILGPLVATGLLAAGLSVRGVFWAAVAPGLLAAGLAVAAVSAAGRSKSEGRGAGSGDQGAGSERDATAGGLGVLVAVLALAAALRTPETLLILRAQDLGVPTALMPALWAALHLVRSAAAYRGGVLSDRWGPRRTLGLGWVLYGLLAWAFAAAGSTAAGVAIFLTFGVATAGTESPERSLVARLAGGAKRGRGFGWYHGALSAVALPGAALIGWLYQSRGAPLALTVSAVTTLLAAVLLAVVTAATRSRAPAGTV